MIQLPIVIVLFAALIAALTDLWKFRVYNVLTFPLLLSGLLFHVWIGGSAGFGQGLLGACVGFAPLIVLYAIGGMGAGDVKLMAGVGAWLGPAMTINVLALSCLAAGLYAILLLVWNRMTVSQPVWVGWTVRQLATQSIVPLAGQKDRRRLIPFGLMIFVGLVASLFWPHPVVS